MRKRVLIAEDNPVNLELARQLLEDDYDLLTAADGEEAVRVAIAERPDVVLMDLSLPRVDGWEATRRLRADPRTAALPVIALTAHAVVGHRERALAAGCTSYVTKPIDEDALLAEVARLAGAAHAATPRAPLHANPAVAAALRAHLPTLTAGARDALLRGDLGALADAAHQLKGGAQMGAQVDLGARAGALEDAARAGDHALAARALDAVEAAVRALLG